MSASSADLMRHALGVHRYGQRWSKPYRNHFAAGDDDAIVWRELVARGYAASAYPDSPLACRFPLFFVTEAGRAFALAGLTFKRRWGYGKPVNT